MNSLVEWMVDVLGWLKIGVALVFWCWILVVLPMVVFSRSRLYGALALLYSSYYTAFSCWWFCFIVCYKAFGGLYLLIGVLLAGIGVIPLAFFGLMVKSFGTPGLGPSVLDVFGAIMLFTVPRWLGFWILHRVSSVPRDASLGKLAAQAEEASSAPPPAPEPPAVVAPEPKQPEAATVEKPMYLVISVKAAAAASTKDEVVAAAVGKFHDDLSTCEVVAQAEADKAGEPFIVIQKSEDGKYQTACEALTPKLPQTEVPSVSPESPENRPTTYYVMPESAKFLVHDNMEASEVIKMNIAVSIFEGCAWQDSRLLAIEDCDSLTNQTGVPHCVLTFNDDGKASILHTSDLPEQDDEDGTDEGEENDKICIFDGMLAEHVAEEADRAVIRKWPAFRQMIEEIAERDRVNQAWLAKNWDSEARKTIREKELEAALGQANEQLRKAAESTKGESNSLLDRLNLRRVKLTVWGWIATITLSGIFAPWSSGTARDSLPMGYHLIFVPPSDVSIHVDQDRLSIEWTVATAIFAGLYFAPPWGSRPKSGQVDLET